MKNKVVILFAVLALIAASLACSLGIGEPTLDNVRMAKDQDGNQLASVFATADTIYVVSDLSNGKAGDVVTSKWYAIDVENTEPNLLFDEADINIDNDGFNGNVYFYYPPPVDGAWPTGTYKVEIYYNEVLIDTANFTVQ
jgi:hypothetical protein